MSTLRIAHLPIEMLQDPLLDQVPQLLDPVLICLLHKLHITYIHTIHIKAMLAQSAEAKTESIVGRIKEVAGKVSWKHAILLSIPLALYIYPTPILKLFMPIATKLAGNHPTVTCNSHLREIILSPNPEITLASLPKLNFLKGTTPTSDDY